MDPDESSVAERPQLAEQNDNYEETDVFTWANNLVQYVDELKIDLYFFNKNYTVYRVKTGGAVSGQFRSLFIDEILLLNFTTCLKSFALSDIFFPSK